MQAANRPLGDVLGDLDKLEDDEATIYVKDGPVDESTESLVLADGEEAHYESRDAYLPVEPAR